MTHVSNRLSESISIPWHTESPPAGSENYQFGFFFSAFLLLDKFIRKGILATCTQ